MHRPVRATTLGASRYRKLSPGRGNPPSQVALDQRTRIQSAMIELVGEGGYEAVALRGLTELAGVSSRTFYEHFESKEECFIRTYELVVRRMAARAASAQVGESDWARRLELSLQGFAAELDNKPRAARLALLEIFAAGSSAFGAMSRAETHFEEMLREGLVSSTPQVEISPLQAKAIVSGVAFVARTRMAGGGPISDATANELCQWALSLQGMPANCTPHGTLTLARRTLSPRRAEPGEREAILAATAKLAAANGYWELTVPQVLAAAGMRKSNFAAHFAGVEDCFLAALRQRTASLVTQAVADSGEELAWSKRIQRTVENLCAGIADDSTTAKLVFVEAHSAGRAAVGLQDRLLADLAGELLHDAPHDDQQISPIHAEASLAAIWGIARSYVKSGRAGQLPDLVPTLTPLLLAPFSHAR